MWPWVSQGFLKGDKRAQIIKEKNWYFGIKKKRQDIIHISDKGLVSSIHKEFLQLNNNKIKITGKDLNRQFTKEKIWIANNKDLKRYVLKTLLIRKTQTKNYLLEWLKFKTQ